MLVSQPCIKCNGQVIARIGLDGKEVFCLSCGYNQESVLPAPEFNTLPSP